MPPKKRSSSSGSDEAPNYAKLQYEEMVKMTKKLDLINKKHNEVVKLCKTVQELKELVMTKKLKKFNDVFTFV